MKYLIILIILILLGVGGYFLFTRMSKSTSQTTSPNQPVSCLTGVEGNKGDNYCSNTYTTSSKCSPGLPNTYPDGCTK